MSAMNLNEKKKQPIRVFIRQRPSTHHEMSSKCVSIIQKISAKEICIKSGYTEKRYNFDQVFGEEANQIDVYNAVVHPLINHTIAGYNCTVFAYGQTGTGKTHTIFGEIPSNHDINIHTDLHIGIIPRAATDLFNQLSKLNPKIEYAIRVSFLEIYNEEVRDLLSESVPLRIYDDSENKGSIYIKDLTEVTVTNSQGVYEWLNIGLMERDRAATTSNVRSSRSHALFNFLVNLREVTSEGEVVIKTGKLQIVDFAGSENLGKSGTVDVRPRELATINKSLITFGKVIKALANKLQHVPYRDSKLTRILQDSLGGGSKTCMIGTISPEVNAWDETVSTLDYAHTTRSIVNTPQVNINKSHKNFLVEMEKEIKELERELEAARRGSGFYLTTKTYEEMTQNSEKKREEIRKLVNESRDLEEAKVNAEEQHQKMIEAFEQTKLYLHAAEDQLKQRETQEKTNEVIIKDALKRDEELVENTNELLKICEVTTKHEDIFYNKYQNQCHATLSNAAIAEEVSSKSLNFLKEVQNLSDNHRKIQDNCVKEINFSTKKLQTNNIRDLEQASRVIAEIQSHIDSYTELKFEDLLRPETKDLSESTILSDLSSLNFIQRKRKDDRSSLEDLKKQILASQLANDEKSTLCLDLVQGRILKREELFSALKGKLNKSREMMTDRLNYLYKQNEDIKESKSSRRKEISKLKKEKEFLVASAKEIREELAELQELKKQTKEKQEALKLKKLSIAFIEAFNTNSETQRQLVDNILSNVDSNERELKIKAEADKQQVENHLTELTGAIKKNLAVHNNGLRGIYQGWNDQMIAVKSDLEQSAAENREVISKNLELMTQEEIAYKSDVEKIIKRTSQDVLNLQKNIIVATRLGDTPAKGNYNYPKNLRKTLPKQVVLERTKEDTEN